MSISAMKQALEALESWQKTCLDCGRGSEELGRATQPIAALRQAIAEAEKQEPVAIGEEWKPCVKLPIVVHVREQRKGETHVSTREGITPVKEDDLIMRGVAGEEYPIGRELFNRTYTFDTAPVHAIDMSEKNVRVSDKNRLIRIMGTFDLATGHADTMDQALDALESELRDVLGYLRARREWVGLTDDEVFNIYKQFDSLQYKSFAKAIEAKLKEKNA
jgi:hypothetical protein